MFAIRVHFSSSKVWVDIFFPKLFKYNFCSLTRCSIMLEKAELLSRLFLDDWEKLDVLLHIFIPICLWANAKWETEKQDLLRLSGGSGAGCHMTDGGAHLFHLHQTIRGENGWAAGLNRPGASAEPQSVLPVVPGQNLRFTFLLFLEGWGLCVCADGFCLSAFAPEPALHPSNQSSSTLKPWQQLHHSPPSSWWLT